MLLNSSISKMSSKRRVLLIYTGGTIGMIKDPKTGILSPFDFESLHERIPEIDLLDIEVGIEAFEKPIDSSNMEPTDWVLIAEIIAENYQNYNGFVILHGSDTMAYTASALSFMFENLGKPIILTGSQLPIGVVRTDGKENIITAIEIAAHLENGEPLISEVAIYFEYQLYRGNRTYKHNAENFQAFRSPNYPILAQAGVHIKYNREFISARPSESMKLNTSMDNSVTVLTLFPGISRSIVQAAASIPHNLVLIVRTFGSGNASSAAWFLKLLSDAIDGGLLLINVSQCLVGGVNQGKYATSTGMQEMGVISAGDMLIEAALTKTMALLGQGYRGEAFRKKFTSALRGEMTVKSDN